MTIQKRNLGRTGLKVSILGLGAGGNSRLGLSTGLSEEHAADVVRAALDMGITMIDTAHVYQTERAVGMALTGYRRENIVLSSKSPYLDSNKQLITPGLFEANIENSLRQLGVDTIDIYFIHGLTAEYYEASRDHYLPVLDKARQSGKIRFIGITEAFERDTSHKMMAKAVHDPEWDVVMVGYNLINQSARERVLAQTQQTGMGTLGMFAVRKALIDETWLRILLKRLAENGEIGQALSEETDLFEALGLKDACKTLSEAAYRFCAYQSGIDCVLSGTSNSQHLKANLEAIQRGPLPEEVLGHLKNLFGNVDSVSAQVR